MPIHNLHMSNSIVSHLGVVLLSLPALATKMTNKKKIKARK